MAKVWRTASAMIGSRSNEGDSYLEQHPRVPAVLLATVNEAGDMDRTHRATANGYIAANPRTPAILTRGVD